VLTETWPGSKLSDEKRVLKLKQLLERFGIKKYCPDGWGAYERHLPVELHDIGKQKLRGLSVSI